MAKRDSSEFKITDPAEMLVAHPLPPLEHPGPWIKSVLLDGLGITVVGAAAAMGVNRPNLHNVLTGRAALTWDMAYRLEALTGVDGDLLMRFQHEHERGQMQERRAQHGREIERVAA